MLAKCSRVLKGVGTATSLKGRAQAMCGAKRGYTNPDKSVEYKVA